jgi:hypothetical protein
VTLYDGSDLHIVVNGKDAQFCAGAGVPAYFRGVGAGAPAYFRGDVRGQPVSYGLPPVLGDGVAAEGQEGPAAEEFYIDLDDVVWRRFKVWELETPPRSQLWVHVDDSGGVLAPCADTALENIHRRAGRRAGSWRLPAWRPVGAFCLRASAEAREGPAGADTERLADILREFIAVSPSGSDAVAADAVCESVARARQLRDLPRSVAVTAIRLLREFIAVSPSGSDALLADRMCAALAELAST